MRPRTMSAAKLKKLKNIPRFLIPGRGKRNAPGMVKRHVAMMCAAIDDQWRLFSEGCLRNRYFREEALRRSPKCKACNKAFDPSSRIEQHHNDYLWSCIGSPLPEGSPDIHRKARPQEFPMVPDCRRCHEENPEHFAACQDRIFPVHASCHELIHDKERYFRNKARDELEQQFKREAPPQ